MYGEKLCLTSYGFLSTEQEFARPGKHLGCVNPDLREVAVFLMAAPCVANNKQQANEFSKVYPHSGSRSFLELSVAPQSALGVC